MIVRWVDIQPDFSGDDPSQIGEDQFTWSVAGYFRCFGSLVAGMTRFGQNIEVDAELARARAN